MAHEISMVNGGVGEAMFALKPAWHGLGTVLDHVPTSAEAITAAHLDWNVNLQTIETGGRIIENMMATVRADNGDPLGIVSDRYKIVQNREAFEFLDSLVADGDMEYESAGALRGGKIVWLLGRMPSVDQIAAGDNCQRYVLFSTTHDGSGAIQTLPTSTRVVCANTRAIALKNAGRGIRHTGDMSSKLAAAKTMLSQFDAGFVQFADDARTLANKGFSSTQAKEFINTLFPEPLGTIGNDGIVIPPSKRAVTVRENAVNAVRERFLSQTCQLPSIKGTWWSLYNAVSEFADHHGKRRSNPENHLLSVLDGTAASLKDRAFELALAMSAV
jgi:phage/plasmid-like protein (TIGR03299 family)